MGKSFFQLKKYIKENQSGITLIAVVVTVIIMLILAGVSLTMIAGDNAILSQASNAKLEYAHSTVTECMNLEYLNYEAENTEKKALNVYVEIEPFIKYLKKHNIITCEIDSPDITYTDSNNVTRQGYYIDIKQLSSKDFSYGKGNKTKTPPKDIYVLLKDDDEGNKFTIQYIGNGGAQKDMVLGTIPPVIQN